jgi:hypothetical protein
MQTPLHEVTLELDVLSRRCLDKLEGAVATKIMNATEAAYFAVDEASRDQQRRGQCARRGQEAIFTLQMLFRILSSRGVIDARLYDELHVRMDRIASELEGMMR